MTEQTPDQAVVHRRRSRISPVWLIPVAAILIGCWLVYQNFISRGPEITLLLDTAEGLQADRTPVKVRDVEVGHVKSVRLTNDYTGAIAVIQMKPDTADLLAPDSSFWVVKPRIGRQGISGLNTILSGAYIQLRPGSDGGPVHKFEALAHPPVTSTDEPGISVRLTSSSDEALNVGDPIIYQGQSVGTVETAEFSTEHDRMTYRLFIKAPYSEVVTDVTQFWLRSGVSLHVDAGGISIQTGSLQSLLTGGVTFGSPDDIEPAEPVEDDTTFKLYASRKAAREDRFERHIPYLVLLDDSIRGLKPGAPVLYRGIRIGTVRHAPHFTPNYEAPDNDFRIPVLIDIEPQRVMDWVDWSNQQWRDNMGLFFEHGLRASIQSANLLTGAMLISLHFTDTDEEYTAKRFDGYPVLPSTPGTITNIQQQISDLLTQLNKLELDQVSGDLRSTLADIDAVIRNLNTLLEAEDTRQLPGEFRAAMAALRQTLSSYRQGTPVYRDLSRMLQQFNNILTDLEPFVRTLKEQPNALIFGAEDKQDPTPRARP